MCPEVLANRVRTAVPHCAHEWTHVTMEIIFLIECGSPHGAHTGSSWNRKEHRLLLRYPGLSVKSQNEVQPRYLGDEM